MFTYEPDGKHVHRNIAFGNRGDHKVTNAKPQVQIIALVTKHSGAGKHKSDERSTLLPESLKTLLRVS